MLIQYTLLNFMFQFGSINIHFVCLNIKKKFELKHPTFYMFKHHAFVSDKI